MPQNEDDVGFLKRQILKHQARKAEHEAAEAGARRWFQKGKLLAFLAVIALVVFIGFKVYNGASSFLSFSWANPFNYFGGEQVETVSARDEDRLEASAIAALAALKTVPLNPDYAAYGTWRVTTFRGADGRICDMTINEQLVRAAAHADGEWIKINDGDTLELQYESGQWIPDDMPAEESTRWAVLLQEIKTQCGGQG